MLVLSRKSGQRIVIGDDVVITILHVRGKHVRIGVEAPDSVRIRREELPETAYPTEPGWEAVGDNRRRAMAR